MTPGQLRLARLRCLHDHYASLPRRNSGVIAMPATRRYLRLNFRGLWEGTDCSVRKAMQRLGFHPETTQADLAVLMASAEATDGPKAQPGDSALSHVYVYEHKILGVLYVGKATNAKRHVSHLNPQGGHGAIWFVNQYDAPGLLAVRVIPADRRSLDAAEKHYIESLRPRLNTTHNAAERAPLTPEEVAAVVLRGQSASADWCI